MTGFSGRTAINELLVMSPELQELANRKAPHVELRRQAVGDVACAQAVLKPSVVGSREHQVRESQLLDVTQALDLCRIEQPLVEPGHPYGAVDRVEDYLVAHGRWRAN